MQEIVSEKKFIKVIKMQCDFIQLFSLRQHLPKSSTPLSLFTLWSAMVSLVDLYSEEPSSVLSDLGMSGPSISLGPFSFGCEKVDTSKGPWNWYYSLSCQCVRMVWLQICKSPRKTPLFLIYFHWLKKDTYTSIQKLIKSFNTWLFFFNG